MVARVDAIHVTILDTFVAGNDDRSRLLLDVQRLVGDNDVCLTSSLSSIVCCHLASSVALLHVSTIGSAVVFVDTAHLLDVTVSHNVSRLTQFSSHYARLAV